MPDAVDGFDWDAGNIAKCIRHGASRVAFTIHEVKGARLIRPISARFMHAKEQRRYEQSQKAQGSGDEDR